ncbi:hypothetical protein AALO_G00002490 [Alosa alosa]|uniref:Uncharacterized protein n=1 Tax=Alosa alosa TaxID=278164 RepID=A0AAV6HHJ5_9TELE|nr:hypothetical protein AALO_G00002490 [Alosa alosa]
MMLRDSEDEDISNWSKWRVGSAIREEEERLQHADILAWTPVVYSLSSLPESPRCSEEPAPRDSAPRCVLSLWMTAIAPSSGM